jgi:hypothetical protein
VVKDTGAKAHAVAGRPLKEPRAIKVVENPDGWPQAVFLRGMLNVATIEDRWRIDDEWWRDQSISRMYFECVLEDGRQETMFKDLLTGRWYRQVG